MKKRLKHLNLPVELIERIEAWPRPFDFTAKVILLLEEALSEDKKVLQREVKELRDLLELEKKIREQKRGDGERRRSA